MFCKYCGNELPEDANFCPQCGKMNEPKKDTKAENAVQSSFDFSSPVYQQTENPLVEREKSHLGGQILKFAILGLSFGCTFLLSWLGLVFSIMTKAKVREYEEKFGETEKQATVGKHLNIPAFIISIIFTAILTLFIFALIVE